jgi:hypothetical protein
MQNSVSRVRLHTQNVTLSVFLIWNMTQVDLCTARLLVTAVPKPWPELQLYASGTASFHSPRTATLGKQPFYSLINISASELRESHDIMFHEEMRRWRRRTARQFRVHFLAKLWIRSKRLRDLKSTSIFQN